jgi:hypothetical protein
MFVMMGASSLEFKSLHSSLGHQRIDRYRACRHYTERSVQPWRGVSFV